MLPAYPLMCPNQFVPVGFTPIYTNTSFNNMMQYSEHSYNQENQSDSPIQYLQPKSLIDPPNIKHRKSHPKTKFTCQEDYKLLQLVKKYGSNNWYQIANEMEGRNIRQCRERWKNYLSPDVENGPWTKEEDDLLFKSFAIYGPKWKFISKFFPTRTDINVKSRFQVHFRRYTKLTKSFLKKKIRKNDSKNGFVLDNQYLPLPLVHNDINDNIVSDESINMSLKSSENGNSNKSSQNENQISMNNNNDKDNDDDDHIGLIHDSFFDLALENLNEFEIFEME